MDAETVAKNIGVGDRIRLLAVRNGKAMTTDGRFSKQALFRLVQQGYADPLERDRSGELTSVKLNRFGLAVRALLKGE